MRRTAARKPKGAQRGASRAETFPSVQTTTQRVRLGAVFPTTEIGNDPAAIRDWAQAAEQLGFDHLIVYDHVLGAVHSGRKPPLTGPYTEHDAFHEPLVLFGYLAAVTTRIELCTGVVILPQRQTALHIARDRHRRGIRRRKTRRLPRTLRLRRRAREIQIGDRLSRISRASTPRRAW
jgi:hypothetical protein